MGDLNVVRSSYKSIRNISIGGAMANIAVKPFIQNTAVIHQTIALFCLLDVMVCNVLIVLANV